MKALIKKILSSILSLLLLITGALNTYSQSNPSKQSASGFMDFNGYHDTRGTTDFTLNLLANPCKQLQYFSLTNFGSQTNSTDLTGYYSEQHLRWNPIKKIPLDITQLWTTISGPRNDQLYYGIRWRPNQTRGIDSVLAKINLLFFVNFHLIGFSENSTTMYLPQIEYVYRLVVLPKLLSNRVYISGFADQTFAVSATNKRSATWVTEHQLGIRAIDGLHVVAEYRINEYAKNQTGWGLGLEYFLDF